MGELFGSAEAASLGGKARAKALSEEEKSEIGRLGAFKRWKKKTARRRAVAEAPLRFAGGAIEFEVAVLDDETRVISERAFSRAIGAKRGGSHWLRKKQNPDGANLPVFLSANNLRPFISMDLGAALSEPISYLTANGQIGNGIRAELIPQILEVWRKARDAGALTAAQQRFAAIADTIGRGLETLGIIALIDEATGYQDVRRKDAIARILEAFVAKELRKWIPTFPLSFFRQVCRLKGIPFREDMKLPPYFGHLVNNLVYERLAPGVLDELRRKNPVTDTGRRKSKHFQWLTKDVGNPSLVFHLGKLEGIAEGFANGDYAGFIKTLDQRMPPQREMPLLEYAEKIKAETEAAASQPD